MSEAQDPTADPAATRVHMIPERHPKHGLRMGVCRTVKPSASHAVPSVLHGDELTSW